LSKIQTKRIRAPLSWHNKIKAKASIEGLTIIDYLKKQENKLDIELNENFKWKYEKTKYPKI